MAANPYDQFDTAAPNPYDQFDAPAQPSSGIPGPRAVEAQTSSAPRRPSSLSATGVGSAAALADVTVGSLIPAAVQQLGYPVLRLTRPPEEAQQATQRVAQKFEQPFGRATGMVGAPEYELSPARRLVDFVGQNIQKGTKWLSEKTGLPVADVENMVGTLSLGAGAVAKPVAQAGARGIAAVKEPIVAGAEMALKPVLEPRRQAASLEGYARGPQIEAAAEAQRLGIVVDPREIRASIGTKTIVGLAGEKGKQALAATNTPRVREIAVKEMGLPPTAQLNGPAAFQEARALVSGPYDQVRKLPVMTGDQALVDRLNSLRIDPNMIGAKEYAPAVDKIIDSAINRVTNGVNGEQLLKEVRVLRERAQKTFKNQSAPIEALDVASVNLAIANALESMIEGNIFNPKLRAEFQDARAKMARTYAYEGATNFNTGVVDVDKLARITSKDNALTGDIASLGRIAGNFPDVFGGQVSPKDLTRQRITRSGLTGTVGTLGAMQLGMGYEGAALLGLTAAGAAEGINALAARRMASPGYQSGIRMYDPRIPAPNQLAPTPGPTIPTNRSLIPYDYAGQQVLPPEYKPNFVLVNQPPPPRVQPGAPGVRADLLPPPSAEKTIAALRAEDARRSGISRAIGREEEARQAASEASRRQSTKGEIILDVDPTTGRLRSASQGVKGATPETFQDFGADLASAANKVALGQKFNLSATEKIAWEKTKVDLAEVAPGFKSLTDKALAEKMMDRQWVEQAMKKAREKAAAFAEIAAKAKTAQAKREAEANRERMFDMAEELEAKLRLPRPTSSGFQGPKTREFKRNQLAPENRNALNQ